MKHLFLSVFLLGQLFISYAQEDSPLHEGTFRKGRWAMSSNPYKPDSWERSYYDNSIRTAFPSDLIAHPDPYLDKLIHLIGVVDTVYADSNGTVTFVLENKYWDYIEDYSIQDEKMFLSEKGDGKFVVTLPGVSTAVFDKLKKFPSEKKLFLVYGKFTGLSNGLPVLAAAQIRYFAYELYTTKVFSYEVQRDGNGNVVATKNGNPQITNFELLKVAGRGQNK